MKIELLKPCHSFSSNSYLISSKNEYAVIDPSSKYDADMIQGKLKYILLTHSHFDHILELDEWAKSGAEVVIFEAEASFLGDPMKNCYRYFDGSNNGYFGTVTPAFDKQEFTLGDESFTLVNLPGHTIGSSAYLFDGCAFVGDTVFAGGGFGRCDLPSGNMLSLFDSIEKVKNFPDDCVLYCGHGESTTVRQYKLDTNR